MGVTKIGRRNANYWIEAVAEGGEDYYTKPGEAPGEWMGELAAELGLDGRGRPRPIRRRPRRQAPAHRRSRWCAAPSREPSSTRAGVSGAWNRSSATTFASPRRSRSRCSTRSAPPRSAPRSCAPTTKRSPRESPTCERHACFVQRGAGAKTIEPGAGLVAMAFRHRSSRAGDPALHTHLVTANLTRAASDGRWLSLAAPKGRTPFWRQAKAAGYVYQAALRANVTRELGLQWHARPQRLRRPRRDRAHRDRALLPAPGRDRRGDGRARHRPPRPPPKSPPTEPATPRTTA